MTQTPHSDSRAPLLESEHLSARDVRNKRLSLFIFLGGAVSLVYALHDTFRGAYLTATLHGIVVLCAFLARYQQVRRKNFNLAGHLLLISNYLGLGLTPLFDGNIRSPGLWCIVVVPVAASLLFGKQSVTRYTVGAFAIILGHYLASPFIDTNDLITQHPEQWALMRIALLFVFGGMSLASGTASWRSQKQITDRTLQIEREAQSANVAERSKSTILATMSHEIRMPMQGVLALIREHDALCEQPREEQASTSMSDHASRVLRLLDALLDLVNLQSGQAKLDEKKFVLGALLERIHLQYEAVAKAKGICLSTRMAVGPSSFVGDAHRIYQLISALVNNAIKFSDDGEIEIFAEVQIKASGITAIERCVVISVRDQGIGMNAEQLSRVFGRFEQVHENLDAQRGSWGLGLAIAQQLTKLMHGTLEAVSKPGHGSTFTLTLPMGQEQLDTNHWSKCLAIEKLDHSSFFPPDSSREPLQAEAVQEKSPSLLNNLTAVVLPLAIACTATALSAGNVTQASVHSICIASMIFACIPGAQNNKIWRPLLFLGALTLSITSQAWVDGTIQSEAMWSIGLLPVMTAFLYNVKAAFVLLSLIITLIIYLTLSPATPFQEVYEGHGVFTTVLLRLACLCAYAGTSYAISLSDLATMTALRRQQRSVERLRKKAVFSNRERDRFLARIRDELGPPIRHIVEQSRAAGQFPGVGAQRRSQLIAIQRCAGHIEQLFKRTINYAANEGQPTVSATPTTFELQELMLNTCRMFSPASTRKDRFLQLVDETQESRVLGDASGIFEVVAVLLTHAIRGGHPGPIYLRLAQVEATGPDLASFEIEVRCAGLTIAAEHRSLIASQDHTLSSLASLPEFGQDPVLRGLVAANHCGGSIYLDSRRGAQDEPSLVFRIELPRAPAPEDRLCA